MNHDMTTVLSSGKEVPTATLVSTILSLKKLLTDNSRVLKELREKLSKLDKMEDRTRIQLETYTIKPLRDANFIAFVHKDGAAELLENVGEIIFLSTALKGPRVALKNPVSKNDQKNHRDIQTLLSYPQR